MKAALISFHNAYNYGACLQAYALQEAVSRLGAECEYIDYVNKRRADGYKMSARVLEAVKKHDVKSAVKNTIGAPFAWSRGRKFDRFYAEKLRKTKKTYRSPEEAAELEPLYDRFIAGSDQIWNAAHNGTDPSYFLSFVKDSRKKGSYASSFGLEHVPEALRAWYTEHLRAMGCLSAREGAGVRIIRELTGRSAQLVLDPVFLVSSDDWKALAGPRKNKGAYTFYYMNAPFDTDDIRRVTGRKDEMKHILSAAVRPKDFIKSGQKVTFALSPEEFLNEILYADLVVTTSFHCLAFSIIFRKPFIAVLSGDEGRDERLLNLLKITGLTDRIFSRTMTKAQAEKTIDYDAAEERLQPFLAHSESYLRAALFEDAETAERLAAPEIPEEEAPAYEICPPVKCTGCGACAAKCPKGAIRMHPDEEGFLRPVIDEKRCVQCGLCRQVCRTVPDKPDAGQRYFALKQEPDVRKRSSSGGAFRTLAAKILQRGGAVIASEMGEDWEAAHTIAFTAEDVERQGKTWYVQGKAYHRYAEAQELLEKGVPVLFTGTPCQISGLRKYLGKDYPDLYTCDIICHGAPSPKMFRIYTRYLETRGKLEALNQRDKESGWKGYCVSAVISGKKYRNSGWLKAYSVMFSHSLLSRPSCYSCPYAGYSRPSDITIGDYWGVEKHRKELADRLGVSLVLTNTKKGQELFDCVKDRAEVVELRKEETFQNSLRHPAKQPAGRLGCMMEMERSYESAAKKYGEWNLKGSVKEALREALLRLKGI